MDEVESKCQLCITGNMDDTYNFIAICPTLAVIRKKWFDRITFDQQNFIACFDKSNNIVQFAKEDRNHLMIN